MIKLSKEGTLKAVICWDLGLLHYMLHQTVNAMAKFLTEIRSAAPVNTQMKRKKTASVMIWRKF